MHYIITITRLVTSFMAALSVLIGALVIVGRDIFQHIPALILSSLAVFFICAGGFVLNDYLDREGDKINHPERPIPSRRITPGKALVLSIGIFVGGLACINILVWFFSPMSVVIILVGVAILISYEVGFKKIGMAGNAMVAILVALTYILGSFVVLPPSEVLKLNTAHVLAILAFFAIMGREIIMDIEDMEGDVKRNTLPRKIGKKKSAVIASSFLIFAILIGPLPLFPLGMLNFYYLPFLLVGDGILLYSIFIQLRSPALARKTTKMALLISSLGFIVGSLK